MKYYLLPQNGHFYKANLHTHSLISDGTRTVEEIKTDYMAHGYSVVAFSDHDVMVDHSDLNEDGFLAITSYEVETSKEGLPWTKAPSYHLNFYAKNPHETYYPCPNPAYTFGNAPKYVQDYYQGDYIRRYSVEGQNEMIAQANAHGFLVCYNHPAWSLHHYPDYAGLEGLCALEVYNTGCYREGYDLDASEHVLEDFLALGKRVFPVAADDSHSTWDCFGGFTMLKAPTLTYDAVMTALEKGDLYASWGPEIHDLRIENGVVKMDCTPVREVFIKTDGRCAKRDTASTPDGITHYEFDLSAYFEEVRVLDISSNAYFRLVLIDAEGNKAVTRGYFADEIPEEAQGLPVHKGEHDE